MDSSVKEGTESPWLCPDCGTPCNHSHCDKCFRPRPVKVLQGRTRYGLRVITPGNSKFVKWKDLPVIDQVFRVIVYAIIASAAFFAILTPLFHLTMALIGRQ